jgi:hypothetical protein
MAILDEHRLSALVYPSVRRKPARIGELQPGSNCQLSSHSGLPALAMPAGFTVDGVPIGMDMLGRDFSDAELLAMGFAFESAARLRRLPFSTPPLVGGKAPAAVRIPTAIGEFDYDLPTATLTYGSNPARLSAQRITAIWLHREDKQQPGAALHPVFRGPGAAPISGVTLSHAAREALLGGTLDFLI